jgi:hypothetical protein
LLLSKHELWIGRNFIKTIPTMKLSQPSVSCDSADSRKICGRFKANKHSRHLRVPQPCRYLRRRDLRSWCVLCCSNHCSTPCVDCTNAAAHPALGHSATRLHVSLHLRQLGQSGLMLSWCAKNLIVPAMPGTCLAAQI